MDLLIAGLVIGSGLAILGFLVREAGLSKRLSLPLWLADAGLALMGAAVAAWLLTAASVSADVPKSTSLAIVGAGSLIAAIAGMLLARRASTLRRAVLAQSSDTGTSRSTAVVDVAESSARDSEPSAVRTATHDDPIPSADNADQDEPAAKRDWEAIWRETWGSGELPKAAGEELLPPHSAGNDGARIAWSEPADESAAPDPGDPPVNRVNGSEHSETDEATTASRDRTADWPS